MLLSARRFSNSFQPSLIAKCFSQAAESYQPSIQDIKKLRQASAAPVGHCKKALIASEGDFPGAFEWLRKKGIASASAKADRDAAEGLIGAISNGRHGAMVEINSETDFVAMNEKFQDIVSQMSNALLVSDKIPNDATNVCTESLLELPVKTETGETLTAGTYVPELVGKVGENLVVRRGSRFSVDDGVVCSYLHNSVKSGLGRAAAMVALEFPTESLSAEAVEDIEAMGRRLAMHVVAAKPLYPSREGIPEEDLQKERSILLEQASDSNKPKHILEKMVEGRLKKFYEEVVLLDQAHFVEEDNPAVHKVIDSTGKKHNVNIKLAGYVRFQVGEKN